MSPCSLKIHSTALALLAALSFVAPAGAGVCTPSPTAEPDGSCDLDCSLRDAITAANQSAGFDVIVLGPGVYAASGSGSEDSNANGDLDILDDLAIVGAGADKTNIEGSAERVLDIAAGTTVEIIGVKISNGRELIGNGGGIHNAGELTLTRVQVSGNSANAGAGGGIFSGGATSSLTIAQSAIVSNVAAGVGGGIALDGPLTLTDSTISGNSAGTLGGGLYAFQNSDAEIVNVTITGNQAASQAGGLYAASTPFQSTDRPVLRDTILAGNTAPTDRDCGGAPASGGHNILGVGGTCIDFTAAKEDLVGTAAAPRDPKLGPLANNGGTTPTHALLAGSPAINAGASCTVADQRGLVRSASSCDIGAFELDATACLTGGPNLCLNEERFKVNVSFKTSQGQTGSGQAVQLTPDTGYFWFFSPSNVEVTIKVLNGCGFNQRFWVFLSGLTNVEVTVTVTDVVTGATKTYTNPQGRTFRTVLDTSAFASCG
jgi:CSLREA domain-containing protein